MDLQPVLDVVTQRCPRCKQDLSLDRYPARHQGKPGNYCTPCGQEYRREWRQWSPRSDRSPAVRTECSRDGCTTRTDQDLCGEHRKQARRAAPPRELSTTYAAVHGRLKSHRGKAADHPCAECGQAAADWAYDHQDPAELFTIGGRGRQSVAYSADLDRYRPLCRSCHADADRRPPAPVPCAPIPEVRHIELAPLARPIRSLIDLRRPREVLGIRKRCPRCEMVKDLGAFGVDRRRLNGRTSRCRPCNAADAADRYLRNPEHHAAYYQANRDRILAAAAERREESAAVRAQHRVRAIRIYGGCCTWCGSVEDLQFDHVNNDGTAHREVESVMEWVRRVSNAGQRDHRWLIQLLCVPCHSGPGWKARRAAGVPAAAGGPP